MRWYINRYSYLIATALAMGGAWALGARVGGIAPAVAVAGVGVGMAAVQRKLRGGPSNVAGWKQLRRAIGGGTPALLFIYSDTCGACLAAQPIADGLEDELGNRADVYRLVVSENVGERARAHYKVEKVPAIILLDRRGTEIYRSEGNLPRKQEILEALKASRK